MKIVEEKKVFAEDEGTQQAFVNGLFGLQHSTKTCIDLIFRWTDVIYLDISKGLPVLVVLGAPRRPGRVNGHLAPVKGASEVVTVLRYARRPILIN